MDEIAPLRAGMPISKRICTVAPAVPCISGFDINVSRSCGHGTVVRMKANGKKNHLAHAAPPASEISAREIPTQHAA